MAQKAKAKQLPKRLHVYVEGEPGDDFYSATSDPDTIDDGHVVGIYELVKKVRVRLETHLDPVG